MSVATKICGLGDERGVMAALQGGARFLGFVFYPPSPRHVTPEQVAALAAAIPSGITKVGLFVDATDDMIGATLAKAPLDLLQLHGEESPERVGQLKRRFGRPVMKAIPVASRPDVDAAKAYLNVADWLLFDAKPPRDLENALPGGNGLVFDWKLLGERSWPLPWMLSGGLSADNLGQAVQITRATAVDVSSGVESRPGHKDPAKIAAFLGAARGL